MEKQPLPKNPTAPIGNRHPFSGQITSSFAEKIEMKKLLFAAFSLAMVGAFGPASAQALTNVMEARILTTPISVNSRAIRNFMHTYPNATDARWDTLKGGGSVCCFHLEGVRSAAYYSAKGKLDGTIFSYTEKGLSTEVRTMVKQTYFDYKILYVNEMDVPGFSKIYFVQMEDENSFMTVRIQDFEMEMVEKFEKI
jgi:hypothetical protein